MEMGGRMESAKDDRVVPVTIKKRRRDMFQQNSFFEFIVASLKGMSQIVLIEHVVTGSLILVAITITSPYLGLITLLSVLIGTLVAKVGGADKAVVQAGLFGYNSALTGLALAIFLTGSYTWALALIGAALVSILTGALMHAVQDTDIPILTFPFVVITWFMLLVSYKLEVFQLSTSLAPGALSEWTLTVEGNLDWLTGFILSVAQIFLLDNLYAGIVLIIALFWGGWKYGVYALIASVSALITAYILGGEHSLISLGLYGYNAVLTIIAVSIVFKEQQNRYAIYSGIIGACLTILITASLSVWLVPFGLPALTMAFVLSTWIFLGARKVMPNL